MKVRFKAMLGENEIEVEGDIPNHKKLFQNLAFFMNLPDKCGGCDKKNLAFNYRSPGNHEYYEILCKDCGFTLPFGKSLTNENELFRGKFIKEKQMTDRSWQPPFDGKTKQQQDQDAVPF